MDLKMSYEYLKATYLSLGEENFFKFFNELFPDYQFYTMSTAWVDSKEYILKFKGAYGDLVIYWKKGIEIN